MATGKALDGKPYAGNPHVRFDEGEVASCTAEASLRRVHCRRQPEAMTRPQVASRSEVARGLRASVCAATPRRGSLLYKKKLMTMLLAAGAALGLLTATSLTAYGDALTVHDGTATSGLVPVQGFWADAYLKCEYVLPASELAAMNGQGIFDMTWYLSTLASGPWTGTFQVFLKEVADTTISAYAGTEGATIVYEGTLDGRAAALKVEFATP